MPLFRHKPTIVNATQWFKNGDHPQDYEKDEHGLENGEMRVFTGAERKAKGWEGGVVRYFRNPSVPGEDLCALCNNTMHDHGWIDPARNSGYSIVVCPGDWVVHDASGVYYSTTPKVLEVNYDQVEETAANSTFEIAEWRGLDQARTEAERA
jgi:hypothetical protein